MTEGPLERAERLAQRIQERANRHAQTGSLDRRAFLLHDLAIIDAVSAQLREELARVRQAVEDEDREHGAEV